MVLLPSGSIDHCGHGKVSFTLKCEFVNAIKFGGRATADQPFAFPKVRTKTDIAGDCARSRKLR
jgi:hypothetical protein